jgi:hypothetical protein
MTKFVFLIFASFLSFGNYTYGQSSKIQSAVCHIDLEPNQLTPKYCNRLDPAISKENLSALKETLAKIYYSNEVQGSEANCAKMADLMQAVCQRKVPITAYFIAKSNKGKTFTPIRTSYDIRLSSKPSSVSQSDIAPTSFDTQCSQLGRTSITITPDCGVIHRCELYKGVTYPGASSCTMASGVYTCYSSMGKILDPKITNSYYVKDFYFTNPSTSCTSDLSRESLTFDRIYATMPSNLTSKAAPAAPFCAAGSSSCQNFNIPLLYQNSADLMQLLTKRTRIARPLDVGFCAPTSVAMMMIGLKNMSGGVFGDNIDSGPSSTSNIDGYASKNWSGAIFQAGKDIGTDWWVGGTPTDQVQAMASSSFGQAAGTVDSFSGMNSDYSNASLINFINQYGGLVNLSVAHDTTAPEPTYHSLLLAGHSGGHLRVLDPWGRAYLVDSSLQTRNAKFVQINKKLFDYANGKTFKVPYYNNEYISWEWTSLPAVNTVFPIWFFNLPNQVTYLNYLNSLGAITIINRPGSAVPTLTQLSGEAGFVYYSPSQQSQFLTGTETAVRNPGPGVYFQAAQSQNILDMLYGLGQRIRGVTWATMRILPTEGLYAAGASAAQSTGWVGSILQDQQFQQAKKTVRPQWITYFAGPCCYASYDSSVSGLTLQTGKSYSFSPQVWQGGVPTNYTVSPSLPPGLYLNSSSGTISGTPSASTGVTKINYVIIASNSGGSLSFKLPISVTGDALAPALAVFDATSAKNYYLGDTVSNLIKITGGIPSTFTVTPSLPAGLYIDFTKQIIGGSSYIRLAGKANSLAPSTNYTFTFSNSYGSTIASYPIAILSPLTPLTAIAPTSFSYSPSSGLNLLIQGSQNYFFRRAVADTLSTRVPTVYTINPSLPSGFSLNPTTGEIVGVPTVAFATTTYTVTASNAAGLAKTTLQISVKAPSAPNAFSYACNTSSTSLALGILINCSVPSSTGYPATSFSITPQLPAGLYISGTTGQIYGNGTEVSPLKTYTVKATNIYGSVSINFALAVTSPNAPSAISYQYAQGLYLGIPVTIGRGYSGGAPTSYTSSPLLPPGFKLDPINGNISALPTAVMPLSTFTITGSNINGSASYGLKISVQPLVAPKTFSYDCSDLSPSVGSYQSCIRSALSGAPVTSYTVTPALPSGLLLNSATGAISGFPTTAVASKTYTIKAANAAGFASVYLTMAINPMQAPKAFKYTSCGGVRDILTSMYIMCIPDSYGAGGPAYSYSISPPLPLGFDFDSNSGMISGFSALPIDPQFYVVTATNTAGSTRANYVLSFRNSAIPPVACDATGLNIGQRYWCRIPDPIGSPLMPPFMISQPLPPGFYLDRENGEILGDVMSQIPMTNFLITSNSPTGIYNTPFTISAGSPSSTMSEDLKYADESSTYYLGDDVALHICVKGPQPNQPVSVSPMLPPNLSMSPFSNGCLTVSGYAAYTQPLVNFSFTFVSITPPQPPISLVITKGYSVVSGNPYQNQFLLYQSIPANSIPSQFIFKMGTPSGTGLPLVTTNIWPSSSPPPTSPPPWIVNPRPYINHFELIGGPLPPGLSFNTATGEISGIPTQPTMRSFAIRGRRTSSGGASVETMGMNLSITVNP